MSSIPPRTLGPFSLLRLGVVAAAGSLVVSAALFFVWTWRWPLVGDASLIHYIAFLIERGWAPYRQLGDMNMPGSFLVELAAMHLFGMGDLGWRLFDFTLVAAAGAAAFLVTTRAGTPGAAWIAGSLPRVGRRITPSGEESPGGRTLPAWLPGLFAASLFLLLHGRDGLAEGGQRDLTMAVCLLSATALLFLAVRRRAAAAAALFGLLSGIAVTIKPTALPLTVLQLALAFAALRREPGRRPWPRLILPATLAYAVAPTAALVFLLREHALAAFLDGLRGIVPYYASLGHRSFSFVVLHSVSPLLPIVLVWLAAGTLGPGVPGATPRWERHCLLAGAVFGLLACIVQQRALPYYRYPLLAFLLPLMALDLTGNVEEYLSSAIRTPRIRAAGLLALAALAYGSFVLAPQSVILLHRYRFRELDFIASLQANLQGLGGPGLSGRIQCIDSISGCGNVLYRMRLQPATGVLSDFLLFGAPPVDPTTISIVRATRRAFSAEVLAQPPQVIVVTSHLHIDGPDDFQKLARWPAFAAFLATRYTLATEWHPTRTARWWSREETPASYRIYLLRPDQSPPLGRHVEHKDCASHAKGVDRTRRLLLTYPVPYYFTWFDRRSPRIALVDYRAC